MKKFIKPISNYQLDTYQPISQIEIETIKTVVAQDDEPHSFFILLILLSKFYLKKRKITTQTISWDCYSLLEQFNLCDNFLINSIQTGPSDDNINSDNKYILKLLNNFSDSHKNYFEIISKLKSESTKRFFHYFYSNNYIFSNFVENISSEKLETFECEVVISAPELYFLLKNKLYEKYDTNFNKTLETIIKNIESIFNYTLKIEFQKSNNTYEELGKDYLNKKFNEHIYNFTITFNPQEENKKEE